MQKRQNGKKNFFGSIFFICALFMLFFLISCQKQQETTLPFFREGFAGPKITAVNQQEKLQTADFQLNYRIHNLGGYTMENAKMQLTGINEKRISFFPTEQPIGDDGTLEGRSLTAYPGGEQSVLIFAGKAKEFPKGAKESTETITIVIDYDYENQLNADVCINPKLLDIVDNPEEQTCTVEPVAAHNGQGSFVGISKIEQQVAPKTAGAPSRADFFLTVENRGEGSVSDFVVKEALLANKPIPCSPAPYVDFKGGKEKAVIHCTTTVESDEVYTTVLTLHATYHYQIVRFEKLVFDAERIEQVKTVG